MHFVGMIIDEKINYINTKNNVSTGMGIMIKTCKYLSKIIFLFLYLKYSFEIWGNACDSYLSQVYDYNITIQFIYFSLYIAHTQQLFNSLATNVLVYFHVMNLGSISRTSHLITFTLTFVFLIMISRHILYEIHICTSNLNNIYLDLI